MPNAILFLCVANSARSQLAEGLARAMGLEGSELYSAGTDPAVIHPLAVRALADLGIDAADQFSKGLDQVPLERVNTVITLCEEEVCPSLPESATHLHWPMPDPAAATGTDEERLDSFRRVRDMIDERLRGWLRSSDRLVV
jgi:thioredoxin type arsenate reductase